MKNILERTNNYFFSGGITIAGEFGYRGFIGSPKIYSRQSLVDAVKKIEAKYPFLTARSSIVVHKEIGTIHLTDAEDYAQRMMDSKVCLAPRGSVADTWRFFEGMKSGCVVITNPLPDEWYYRGAPVIQLDHWNELEGVLLPLLADEERLQRIQQATLRYWDEVCGEAAVARYIAAALACPEP